MSADGQYLAVFAALTAVAAIAAPVARGQRRFAMAVGLVLACLAGEGFTLSSAVERMATERAERALIMSATTQPRMLEFSARM
jgi:hypothetical protein